MNDVAGELIVLNDNGAWSWFEDERAIVDTAAGKILVSSVANAGGSGGASRNGDVASFDLASGIVSRFTLSDSLEADDHNSAALWRRPDGRYLALYARHGSDNFTRYRISTNPGDITSWSPEQTFNNGAGTTYSNLHYLPADNGGVGWLYNFTRTVNFDPNVLVSNDFGSTWSYGGKLLTEGGGSDRPYARYFSNEERIHVINIFALGGMATIAAHGVRVRETGAVGMQRQSFQLLQNLSGLHTSSGNAASSTGGSRHVSAIIV